MIYVLWESYITKVFQVQGNFVISFCLVAFFSWLILAFLTSLLFSIYLLSPSCEIQSHILKQWCLKNQGLPLIFHKRHELFLRNKIAPKISPPKYCKQNPWKKTPSVADPPRSCIRYWHPEKLHRKLFLVQHIHRCSILSPHASYPILVVMVMMMEMMRNEDKDENCFHLASLCQVQVKCTASMI